MKCGKSSIDSLMKELERQALSKKDMIVPAPKMSLDTMANDGCRLIVKEQAGPQCYGLTEHACQQLASRLEIPTVYFRRMRELEPRLLDINVNWWLDRQPDVKYMVRVLDGKARAILSNRYRRLDNFELAQFVVPVLQNLPGAIFESLELTDRRFYVKVVCRSVEFEIQPGDIVQAGVVVCNSEVGCGATYVKPLIYRLICKNGLIASDRTLLRNHLGRAIGGDFDDATVFADETLAADDQAFFLRMRDIVRAAVSEVTFTMLSEKLKNTLGIQLTGDTEAAVEVLGNKYGMLDAERSGVLLRLQANNDPTGYGLINAVTEYAQMIPDYDRATEFEEIGGKLLDLPIREWRQLARAA
ncbi:DUF932 domain-containing protein [Pseudoduganella buxea]|uniref:DUF932 domain-containing protein n=1 Tax=Pseudoduganella buxea TaxID=1949069 RepID=A0A6I3T071_9BURK|nr:DUF932 domain-containing protein [Pseudoduganella buxea]MTV54744.1 DUF932 domain-containing protein [Pseudoduganella buxea]GGC22407.1 hypothetical protein GCM10011572_49870 [Pseudoduganella buxea]